MKEYFAAESAVICKVPWRCKSSCKCERFNATNDLLICMWLLDCLGQEIQAHRFACIQGWDLPFGGNDTKRINLWRNETETLYPRKEKSMLMSSNCITKWWTSQHAITSIVSILATDENAIITTIMKYYGHKFVWTPDEWSIMKRNTIHTRLTKHS